jgi:hypothetical protein
MSSWNCCEASMHWINEFVIQSNHSLQTEKNFIHIYWSRSIPPVAKNPPANRLLIIVTLNNQTALT